DSVLVLLSTLQVLEAHLASDGDGIGVDLILVDDPRVAQHLLEGGNPALHEGLLVFRVVILRVFRYVSKLQSLFDAGCYFTPLNGLEVVQLLFELGQTVRGEQNLFVSHQTLTLLYYERLLCSASQRSSGSCRDLFVHVSLRSQDNHKALPKTGQCLPQIVCTSWFRRRLYPSSSANVNPRWGVGLSQALWG